MEKYFGKSILDGIAIGKILVYKKNPYVIHPVEVENVEEEIRRFLKGKEEAVSQLRGLYDKTLAEMGEEDAKIFKAHQMMLEDEFYAESVTQIIANQEVNAEYAVSVIRDKYVAIFASMENEYMRTRAMDVRDISDRMLRILQGDCSWDWIMEEPVILVADDWAPSEIIQLDKSKVLALVIRQGALNSHTSILARTMSIPALIQTDVPVDKSLDGVVGIVDSSSEVFYVNPTEDFLHHMEEKKVEEEEQLRLLHMLKGKDSVTLDGRRVMLHANISGLLDLESAVHNDAEGIGLFRSECIYLERENYPSEEEQFQIYKQAVETMAGKPVVIRTLDIGADKKCDYFEMEPEENPAMGCRAIRLCLKRPEIMKIQLSALLRASAFGDLRILYPMITSEKEICQIQNILEDAKIELRERGISFGEPKQGIMIETPAAVMMSEELAKQVDFFSIGTNDLTQYTLAIDRQNSDLEEFYDARHPAILKMISMTVDSAHKAGISVGICGELATDSKLTKEFLRMGVDELSVSPGRILSLRKEIREIVL